VIFTAAEAAGFLRDVDRAERPARERNAYRDRFPDVPDERDWPTRDEDDATLDRAERSGQ